MVKTRLPLRERLAQGPLLFDGAMGTELYKRGVFINQNYDAVSLSNPTLVKRIHEDYIKAGAQAIETNTFGANRIKLHPAGLADQVADINRAGVDIARQAAGDDVYVIGAVGPTGLHWGAMSAEEVDEIRSAFVEQIRVLVDSGVDALTLETFRQIDEIAIALEAARAVSRDVVVIAQMAFTEDGTVADGTPAEQVVERLKELGADVVGANCAEGPATLYEVARRMVGRGLPVSIQPNAGYPKRMGERYIYMATPEYFGVYAMHFFKLGVRIVGGCCGTGPEHIAQMAGSARMVAGGRVHVEASGPAPQPTDQPGLRPWGMAEKSALGRKLARGRDFAVSVEITPPPGLDPRSAIEQARLLKAAGVDVVNIPDNARAVVRMSNAALAMHIRQQVGVDVILHVCCRDRNFLAMQSDLLGYHIMGVRNLVIITGDPPKVGDYPNSTAVFDLDSIGLLRVVDGFNHGLDPAGRSLNATTSFLLGCGAEPAATDYERELRRLEEKKAAGAEYIMTQPVYEPAVIDRFLRDTAHLEMPTMIGLLPLASYKNAEFLHNEVPGMSVPLEIRERMRQVGKGAEARAEGVRIAQDALEAVKDRISGVYIMPPFGRVEAAVEILAAIGFERPAAWAGSWRE